MTDRKASAIQKLNDSRAYLNSILDQVGNRGETGVYADGAAWNIRQLTIHLADSDKGQSRVLMAIIAGQDLIPPDFDIERYNRRMTEKRAEVTFAEARASLAESRAELLHWLNSADDSVFNHSGRHASLKILTVEEFLGVIADHERSHAADIAAVLNA
ncbi:MAG: DinB family protein [Anaerolineae bacterium]|nr:DinB family protein [Anaerolineae bacterium]